MNKIGFLFMNIDKNQKEVNMLELNDVILETVSGGNRAASLLKIEKTNNSTVKLYNFSVKGSGGVAVIVTQSIG